jgi:hypothetical protein
MPFQWTEDTPQIVVVRPLAGADSRTDPRVELVFFMKDRTKDQFEGTRNLKTFWQPGAIEEAREWCREQGKEIVGKPIIVKRPGY